MKRGKHYIDSKKLIDSTKLYESQEAIALAVQTAKSKFDETIELHVKLGIDPRHADQQVRGVVVLPNGTGKTVRVLAICKGAKADEAQAAGADFVGGEEMIQKIQQENWFDYDVIPLARLATPSEIAKAILYLAESGYCVGSVLSITAGL